MGYYKGPASTEKDAMKKEDGFKKGGRTKKKCGGFMKGKKEMMAEGSDADDRADRPRRKAGGAVMSSAASGTPRGKASHY